MSQQGLHAGAASATARAAPAAWGAAVILMIAYALSWMDRSLPTILIEPMKASLGASDTQLALLTGFAFALCHATLAVPLGWIADRWDRARLITIGVLLWSAMTLACGYATTFGALFILRMGVGLGEAVLVPAAYALISDLFPRRDRPKALMIFVLGSPIGSALALAGGGGLHRLFEAWEAGPLGGLEPWRATFAAVGAIGIAVACLTMRLPEPRRGQGLAASGSAPAAATADTRSFVAYLRQASFFLVPLVIGVTLFNVFVNGFLAWLAPLFARTYGWSLATAGVSLGAATLIAGLVGAPLGAAAAALIGRWRKRDAAVAVLVLCAVCLGPLAVLSPLAPDGRIAYAGVCVALLLIMGAAAVAPVAVVNSAPASMRARVSAVYLLVANLVGSGTGAMIYALATDYVFADPAKLNLSMASVSAGLLAAIVASLLVADRRYERVMRLSGEADSFSEQGSRRSSSAPTAPASRPALRHSHRDLQ